VTAALAATAAGVVRLPVTRVPIGAEVVIGSVIGASRVAVDLVTPARSVAGGAAEPVPALVVHVAPPVWGQPEVVAQGVAEADAADDESIHTIRRNHETRTA